MKSYYIHRLGCPKNDVDADYLSGFLRSERLSPVHRPEEADLVIVNSCAFIEDAKQQSIDAIIELAKLKESNGVKKIVVTGCLSQRYADELAEEIPELDGVFGLHNFMEIKKLFNGNGSRVIARTANPIAYPNYHFQRDVQTFEPYAYIKISDGCDFKCSYCAIPGIRGRFRSRPIEQIVDETRMLIESGKKELVLVSQEAIGYGMDLYKRSRYLDLLDALSELDDSVWIRVMYLHPARLNEEIVSYMIGSKTICSYFELPLQHINDRMLKRMRRIASRKEIEELLASTRSRSSDIGIRTTFIVGFPGETEGEFEELCDFVRDQRFDRMGVFKYSREEGTSADRYDDQVDEETKQERHDRLMLLQQEIAFARNAKEKGKRYTVLIDSIDMDRQCAVGRTRFDAPEIDQLVYVDDASFRPGDFAEVEITGYDGYDLSAKPVG
jgi:ribosomal protein S12 methylthiotransferase